MFFRKYVPFILFYLVLLTFVSPVSAANDIYRINAGQSDKDVRASYVFDLLYEALEQTKEEYGDYKVQILKLALPNFRKMEQVKQGVTINVGLAVTTKEWEANTIPIRIPLRRGALNFRLLLIHRDKLSQFEGITNKTDLANLTVGLRRSWATWQTFSDLGWQIVNVFSYESVFGMLDKQRFDYVPRGFYEVFDEVSLRKQQFPSLTVAPNIAVYIPAPFYFFVSPQTPRLAKRLELGLNKIVENGYLAQAFERTYGQHIKQANFAQRRLINVGNPELPKNTPLDDKRLWLDWSEITGKEKTF